MRSDLRNLATAEEAYYSQHHRYSNDLTAVAYSPGQSITVTVMSASAEGWAAKASHPATSFTCRVGFGSDSIREVGDGVLQCLRPR